MAVRIKRRSRLQFHNLITVDDFEFWDHAVLPVPDVQPDDVLYQVKDGDRLDLLAFRFYGDPILWWVIAVANGIELNPVQFNTGDKLRIPAPRFVGGELFKRQ